MAGAGAILGMLMTLGLLLAGLPYLPQPAVSSVDGLFSLAWFAGALMVLIAYGRQVWQQEMLKTLRKKWRVTDRQAANEEVFNQAFSRQRERRLD